MTNINEEESKPALSASEALEPVESKVESQSAASVAVLEKEAPEKEKDSEERLEQNDLTEDAPDPITTPKPRQQSKLVNPPQKLLSRFEDFMVPALVLFLLGCALAFALPNLAFAYWQIGLPLLVVLLGIVIYGANKSDSRWVIRLDAWVMVLILGAMYYHYRQFSPGLQDISRLAPRSQVEIVGTVTSVLSNHRLVVAISKANREITTGQVIFYLPKSHENSSIEVGTRLLVSGELSIPYASSLPGVFNYQEYLRSQHITALLKNPSRMIAYETSNQPQFLIQRWADALKQRISDTFTHALPSPQAEVLGGIVLGDKAIPVDAATKQAFIQTGLIHVLAASGMNVGIIAMAVLWLMRRFRAPRHIQFGVSMLAVAFYSLLTGLPPSIQRASAMLELALLLKMLNKELSPIFLLCVASTLLVLISADNIASVSFQFSVLTTFGLLSMVPPLQEFLGYYITRWLAGLILVPLVAQLWIWPLSVAYFNQFPIHSVPLNIVALALVTPLTIIGFVAGVASIVFEPLGAMCCKLAQPVLNGLLWLVHGGNSLTWAQWSFPSPEPWVIGGLYLCLFVFLALIGRFKKWSLERKLWVGLLSITLLVGGLCLENGQAHNTTRLEWLPLSENKQAILLQPAHQQGLMLIAPQRLRYYEARSLADFLKHRHIDHLSGLLLIPPSEVGAGRLASLKQAFRQTSIDTLVTSEEAPTDALPGVKQQMAFPSSGARLQMGNLHLEGLLNQLAIFSGKACLLSLRQVSESPSEALPAADNPDLAFLDSCAVQASVGSEGTQLNGQSALEPGQYHQWVQDGPRLTLF